jgi:hypothetical protein
LRANAASFSKDALLCASEALAENAQGCLLGDVAAHSYEVNSYQMAYQEIREYYAVCLPVTLRVEDRGLSRASERRRQSQLR